MSPTKKKATVTKELREKWLERNERGESSPAIAHADFYDPRTVRKYLEVARQERESKEARGTVLRSALERHYADMCRYAESLAGTFGAYANEADDNLGTVVRYGEQLRTALREHLPRSPIWGYLNRIAKLNAGKAELMRELTSVIEESIATDPGLKSQFTEKENGVVPGLIEAFKSQAERWAQGLPGLNVRDNVKRGTAESEFVNMHYGPFNMGKVGNDHIELLGRAIDDWTARIKEWETYRDLERTVRDLRRLEEKRRDEVAVIVLRRVVPGRCRYCPL